MRSGQNEETKDFKGFGKKPLPQQEPLSLSTAAEAMNDSKSTALKVDDDLENDIKNSKMFVNMKKTRENELDMKIAKLNEEESLLASDPSVGGKINCVFLHIYH
jgi:hypothetical protein